MRYEITVYVLCGRKLGPILYCTLNSTTGKYGLEACTHEGTSRMDLSQGLVPAPSLCTHAVPMKRSHVNEVWRAHHVSVYVEKLNENCVAHMLQYKNGNKYIVFALKMA